MAAKPKTKTAKSLAELARQHGISRETLRGWRDSGLNVQDPAALAARIKTMPRNSTDETLAEAKRRRAVADADRAEILARRESGAVVDLATVEASFAALGHQMRAHLLALPLAAASELEGLPAKGIAAALRRHVLDILTILYEQSHEATRLPEATS
jgi:transposase-like protein